MARIMTDEEFNQFFEIVEKEFGDMEPGNDKRIRLIGAIEGYAGDKFALTGTQLEKIFDLGFKKEK